MSDDLTECLTGKRGLVVESQSPIALQIQVLALDAGAKEMHLAASLQEAQGFLDAGFRPDFAIVDLRLFDDDARDLIAALIGTGMALVVTTALAGGWQCPSLDQAVLLRKPYFEVEMKDAIVKSFDRSRPGPG